MENEQIDRKAHALLKAVDVANILNVSKSFAYQLMGQGKLRTVRINGARRVRMSDLFSFIEASLSPPPDLSVDS